MKKKLYLGIIVAGLWFAIQQSNTASAAESWDRSSREAPITTPEHNYGSPPPMPTKVPASPKYESMWTPEAGEPLPPPPKKGKGKK